MLRLAFAIVLVACGSSGSASIDAPVSLDGLSCLAEGNCSGVECGSTCCAEGEACIDGACMCGSHGACTDGNRCVSPVVTTDHCGGICCGVTSVCPGLTGDDSSRLVPSPR